MKANVAGAVMNELPSCIIPQGTGSLLIYSGGKQESITQPPMRYLEDLILPSCSTLQGRVQAFRKLLDVSQKPCVLISERTQKTYFPTRGLDHPDCAFYLYQDVISYSAIDADHTQLLLESGLKLIVEVNVRTIRGQMERCARFLEMLNVR